MLDLICIKLERDTSSFTDGRTAELTRATLRSAEPINWNRTTIEIQAPNADAFPDLAVGKVYTLSLTLCDDQKLVIRREYEY